MINFNWTKKLTTAFIAVMLVLALAVSIPFASDAHAADMGISNGDFASYGSTEFDPSNWSWSGDNNKETFSGVYSGDYDQKKHGFDNADKLVARDGKTEKDFLLINSKNHQLYSAYSTASIALEKNSYYQFVAWAKAEVTNDNAYFSINGLEEDVYLPIENDGEWHIYKIYLATDSINASSASITLSLGKDGARATGYVMFDDVSAESLSVKDFADLAESDNVLIKNFQSKYITEGVSYIAGGDFAKLDYTKWSVSNSSYVSVIPATGTELIANNVITAPNYVGTENNVLKLSSGEEENDVGVYASVTSNEFTLEMNKYYRISYFVLDAGNTDTTVGATSKLFYKYAENAGDFLSIEATNIQLTNDTYTANSSHFNWIERAFYVKGSAYANITAKIMFALGNEATDSKGTVLIDDVRIQELDAATYTEAAVDSTVTVDADSAISDSTGIPNGNFGIYTVEDGKFIPSSWTLTAPSDSDVACFGFSSAVVDNDAATYEVVREVPSTLNFSKLGFTLKMASSEKTAFALRSSAISVTADTYGLFTVNMATMNLDGFGASIVIRKDNGAILTKIENITDTKFDDYSFCIKAGSEAASVYVEIWLGLNDRNLNKDKLASGEVYVSSVTYATADEATYTAFENSYNNKTNAASAATSDAWYAYDKDATTFEKPLYNWTKYQSVADADNQIGVTYTAVKEDEEYVVKLTNHAPNASAIELNTSYALEASSYYKVTMMVKIDGHLDSMNGTPDDNTVIENYRGAKAGVITGSDTYETTTYVVENIKTTLADNGVDEYVTLEFFVKTSEEASTLKVFLGLGQYQAPTVAEDEYYGTNEDNSNVTETEDTTEDEEVIALTRGSVYLKGITVESSSTTEFDDAENDLGDYQVLVNLAGTSSGDEETEEEETSSAITWESGLLMFSSILLGVVVLAVAGAFLWKKYAKKIKGKKTVTIGKATYDRSNLYTNDDDAKTDEIKNEKDATAVTDTTPGAIDSLDDDTTEEATEAPAEEATEAPSMEATEAPAEEAPEATAEEAAEATSTEAADDSKTE